MRITMIEAIPVRIPLKPERRMISALGRHEVSDFLVVRVETDAGIEGVGEAKVTPRWCGETVRGAQAIIEDVFASVILGVDPLDHAEIDRRLDAAAVGNWFAKSAIEMACWDIAGKVVQKPVYELLGGKCRPLTVKSRFSLGAYEPSVAAERACERVAAGFDMIKVKVGTDPDEDIRRVKAVREAIGPDIRLTIDANGGWNEDDAIRCLRELDACALTLVEQPLIRGDYTSLKRLRSLTGQKILADESCFDEVEAGELILQDCCDALSLYPGKQGGIRKARRIAQLAGEHRIPCTIGSNLEWDIATAAMLHFIVSTPSVEIELYPGDCLGPSYHEFSIARNPLRIDGPLSTLGEGPGLGVDVDWERVRDNQLHFVA